MSIVRLTPEDGLRLRALRLAALRDAPDAFGSTYAESAARSPEVWRRQLADLPTFVACVDGADVGMARGAPSSERAGDAWLLSMWVAPGARGLGLGAALVAAVRDWARAAGFTRLVLDVADDNAPAIALYSRLGFEPTGDVGSLPPPRAHIGEHRRALSLA